MRDQEKQTESTTHSLTSKGTSGHKTDKQILHSFTQLYYKGRPPSWSPSQGQGVRQRILESSAEGQIQTERLTKNKQIIAPVTRGSGAPSHKTPTGITSDRGAPHMEGGTNVGDRRKTGRDLALTLRGRPPETQRGALGETGSASGESGRGKEDRIKGKK